MQQSVQAVAAGSELVRNILDHAHRPWRAVSEQLLFTRRCGARLSMEKRVAPFNELLELLGRRTTLDLIGAGGQS